jgi:hypothetical protein
MTKQITVQGVLVDITQPYEAGHTITEAEAKALNQTRSENIGNNVRKVIKELVDAGGDAAEIQAAAQKLVAEKDKGYEFTMASVGGGARLDPLAKECQAIARNFIGGKLKEMGITQKQYLEKNGEDAIKIKIAELAEHPEIIKAAKKALTERAKIAESTSTITL